MKKIAFLGAYDKADFVMYVAKIIQETGKRVLIVDGTILQKMKYIIPNIQPTSQYITTFEKMDIAVGFHNLNEVKVVLGQQGNELDYDYVFLDVDTPAIAAGFNIEEFDLFYYASSFDMFSLKRGLEIFSVFRKPIKATKILYLKEITQEDNDYLDFLTTGMRVEWNEDIIFMPFENGDQSVLFKNQKSTKIRIRRLSEQFKAGLMYCATQIVGEEFTGDLEKAKRNLEKGV